MLKCKGRNQGRQPDLHEGWLALPLGRFGSIGADHEGGQDHEGALLSGKVVACASVCAGPTDQRSFLLKSRKRKTWERQQGSVADLQGRQKRPIPLDQVIVDEIT